jgi:hypothetical protein
VNLAGEMQWCMVEMDVERARKIWPLIAPHLPPISNDQEMLSTLHLARTQSEVLALKLRYYSHCWLIERGLPTMLPDHLRPSAERMYPRSQTAVGISINTKSELFGPVMTKVRGAMEDAVLEIYADGRSEDTGLIKRRMFEARHRIIKKLLGV